MEAYDDFLPLVDMGDELARVVLEKKEFVAGGGVYEGRELVLNSLPGSEIGSVLVAILPHGSPGLKNGLGGRGADL